MIVRCFDFPFVNGTAAGPVVAVGNPAGFSKQFRKSSRKILPKATLIDFLICGRFHRPPRSFVLVLPFREPPLEVCGKIFHQDRV
jgi:hypothetical protein